MCSPFPSCPPATELCYVDTSNTPGRIDTFQYETCDAVYGACALASVTINVDPPHADLIIFKEHVGTLYQGQLGASIRIHVFMLVWPPLTVPSRFLTDAAAGLSATDIFGAGGK